MKLTAKICLKIFKITAVLVVLFVGFVAVRILYAPLSIPYASAFGTAFAPDGSEDWSVELEEGIVGWDWRNVRPWVRIKHLKASNPSGTIIVDLDEAWVAFNRAPIFGGDIQIEGISALNGYVTITQGGGSSFFGDLDFSKGPQIVGPFVQEILNIDKRVSDLELINLNLDFKNREGVSLVQGTIPSVTRVRRGDVSTITVTSAFKKQNQHANARLLVKVDHDDRSAELSFDIDPVKPGAFMGDFSRSKTVDALASIMVPMSLSLDMEASIERGLETGELVLNATRGELAHHWLYPEAAPITSAYLLAAYDPESEKVGINQIELVLEDLTIVGDGFVYFEEAKARPGIRAALTIDELTIAELQRYFPRTGSGNTWKFLRERMGKGFVENVHFQLDSRPDGSGPWENSSVIRTDFAFRGVNAKYTPTMPELTGGFGTGTVTKETLRMDISGGEVGGISLSPSNLFTYDIHKPGESQSVLDIFFETDAARLLALASNEPINIHQKLNTPLENFGGTMDVALHIDGPLRNQTKVEDLDYNITILSDDFSLKDIMRDADAHDGDVTIAITKSDLQAEGSLKVNGTPMRFTLTENLDPARDMDVPATDLKINGMWDGEALLAMRVPADPYVKSPMAFDVAFWGSQGQFEAGKFSADATNADIHLPQLGWNKKKGRAATVSGEIEINGERGRLHDFSFIGDAINMTAILDFPFGDEGPSSGRLMINALDDTKNMAVVVNRDAAGPYVLAVDAETLDVRGILDFEEQDARNKSLATTEIIEMDILLKAENLILANGETMTDVSFSGLFVDESPRDSSFSGTFADGTVASMTIGEGEASPRPITIETTNAGKLLRGMGLFVHGDGGTMTFEGVTNGWADEFTLDGRAKAEKITLLPSDKLPEGVTEGIMPGLDRIAGRDGEVFDKADMPFKFERGLLDVSNMAANNSSIGLTLEGQLDRQSGLINMNGVFIPAYGLNSVLNKIPIIGTILGGGKKEGIIGITYRVKGDIENPEVNVNPMSGATPGILRKIFGGGKGKVERPAEPQSEKLTSDETEGDGS